jgi:hypothetical protein
MTRNMLTNEQGARTTLYCATSPDVADETGLYYSNCRQKPVSDAAQDDALAHELWERSERWVAAG